MTKIMKGGVAYNSTSNFVALTQAEYDALSTAQKNNGNFYFIVDSDPSYFSATNIDYDNTDSGLTATNVQDAIDEVKGDIPAVDSALSDSSTNPVQNKVVKAALDTKPTVTRQEVKNFLDLLVFNMGFQGDLNDATSYGLALISASGATHAPSSNWCYVLSLPMNGNKNYTIQLGFVLGSTNIYIRYCNNGTWSNWRTI